MRRGCTEEHIEWIDRELRPLLDDQFRVIVLNNLSRGSGDEGKFRNVTFVISAEDRPTRRFTRSAATPRSSCPASRRPIPRAAGTTG